MLFTKQNFLNILLQECKNLDEKCDGYKEELEKAVLGIVELEKRHSIQGTNIRQQITKICEKAGDYLSERQNNTQTAKGESNEIDQS